MGSLRVQFSFLKEVQISTRQVVYETNQKTVVCGLRNGPRKPMWRSRVLSSEAIQAVHSVKLATSPDKLEEILKKKLSRLLKADVLDTLTELQRQNEVHLALKVFNFVRNEEWYIPDLSVFNSMIMMLGKNKFIKTVEQLFVHMMKEGLQPDSRTYTELIGAYFRVHLIEKAMEAYELMKISGFFPDELTMRILIRNLEKAEEKELVVRVKKECANYIDYPEKFLKETERSTNRYHVRACSSNDKNHFIARFASGLPKFSKKKNDSKWTLQKEGLQGRQVADSLRDKSAFADVLLR